MLKSLFVSGRARKPSEDLRRIESLPIPSGEIEAVNAASRSFPDTEEVVERSRVVAYAESRMPVIGSDSRYNEHWYVDAVVLPHNSIRVLLSSLYKMLTAVRQLSLDLTRADYDKLIAFMSQFRRYVAVIFEAEERILYPSVQEKFPYMIERFTELHPLKLISRDVKKRKLLNDLSRLIKYINDSPIFDKPRTFTSSQMTSLPLEYLPAITTLPSLTVSVESAEKIEGRKTLADHIQDEVDKFTTDLLEYFTVKEKCIPKILAKSIRGSRERQRMERLLIRFFRDMGEEYYFSALLATSLSKEEVRKDFIRRHFRSHKRRGSFVAAVSQVEAFLSTTDAFEVAAIKYQNRFSVQEFMTQYDTANNSIRLTQGSVEDINASQ